MPNTSNGPIQLWRNSFTSLSYTAGRVQIYFENIWGNICDDVDFGIEEANVICHQLGFSGASSQSRAGDDRCSCIRGLSFKIAVKNFLF